jgi:predicted aldo/keto reductase-like oxidoreductase
MREKMFIVSKASGAKDSASRDEKLAMSLSKLNTSYLDLYYGVHGLKKPEQLSDELKNWAATAKEKGLIKFFGFSTHSNMADCMKAAAETDWIDAIMTKYDYRMADDKEMQEAVDKCHKKGIALIAMKTQAKGPTDEPDYKLISHFQDKGFSPEQAKLKAIWQDERFCAICSQMPSFTILNANIAAALDTTKLSDKDVKVLKEQAANNYCLGCEKICSEACAEMPFVADVMRSLMYANSYGSFELGKQAFHEIPQEVRERIADADFTVAQTRCPKNLPIANLMKQAYYQFA